MSITTQIQALTQDRADIRSALVTKGVASATGSGYDEFPGDILSLFTGSSGHIYIDLTRIGYSDIENIEGNGPIYRELKKSKDCLDRKLSNLSPSSSVYHSGSYTGMFFPNVPELAIVENVSYLAEGNTDVKWIDSFDISGAKTCGWCFLSCSNLVHVGPITTSNDLYQCADMFRECPKLTEVPLFNTAHVVDFSGMFWGCTSLTSIPDFEVTSSSYVHPSYGTGSINMNDMFRYCTGLQGTISSTVFANMGAVKNAGGMFYSCSNITGIQETLDLGSLTYSERPPEDSGLWGGDDMFFGCNRLQTLKIENLKVNLGTRGLGSCPLTSESINYIVEHLGIPEAGTDTFYVGSSNLAKLTSSSIASAEAKGWTISA